MSFIKINGLNTYYEKSGRKGKNVILLHGWGQNSEMMAYIANFLKKNFVVYNFDLPGFGKSDNPFDAWGIDEYSEHIKAFCDEKNIENPIIIGHSFGCRIAFKFAYKYPVYKMILTGAAGIRPKRDLAYYIKIYSYKIAKFLLAHHLFENQLRKYQEEAGSDDYKNTSGVMRKTFVKVVNEDLAPLLKDIDVPTLLVWGDKDDATPLANGKQMEKEMGDATLVVFEGDDHFAYFHQADRFNRVLEAYLKEDYEK